jgi:hypothetical protein
VLDDFRRLLSRGTAVERQAAVLALLESPDAAARPLVGAEPELAGAAKAGKFSWVTLATGAA